MIDVKNLSVRYDGVFAAIDGISFSVAAGESVGIVGANGAGKSTLLLALANALKYGGEVSVGGRIGVIFQNPDDQVFMPTVREDIAFMPRNFGMDNIDLRVQKIAAALNIENLLDRFSHKLSGGEKRLAALAGVLIGEPDILLLDEPSAFLDPRARRNLIGILKDLPQTKIIATHDLDMAYELCPRVIILAKGKIAADGGNLLKDEKLLSSCGLELPLMFAKTL